MCDVSSSNSVASDKCENDNVSDELNVKKNPVNFVRAGKLNNEAKKSENSSNAEVVQKKILKKEQPSQCHNDSESSQPSTSNHCGHKNKDSSSHRNPHQWTYVERRTCFQCGVVGHVFADCRYKIKEKRHDVPKCPQMTSKPKTVKIQVEHLRKPVPEKVLKLSRPQRRRLNKRLRKEKLLLEQSHLKNAFQSNQNVKFKEQWKAKVSRKVSPVHNHESQNNVTRKSVSSSQPKTTKAWVPVSN